MLALFASITLFSSYSCGNGKEDQNSFNNTEIDLSQYFKIEIERLKRLNPEITKTVLKDNEEETKDILIKDWETELSSFASIDLNKPAYKGLFKKDSSQNIVTYSFTDEKLDLSKVILQYKSNSIEKIEVFRKSDNLLYTTKEILTYEPNKQYIVDKKQHVWILGDTHYIIKGIF